MIKYIYMYIYVCVFVCVCMFIAISYFCRYDCLFISYTFSRCSSFEFSKHVQILVCFYCIRFRHAAITSLVKGTHLPKSSKSNQLISLALQVDSSNRVSLNSHFGQGMYIYFCFGLLLTVYCSTDSVIKPFSRLCLSFIYSFSQS